MGRITKTPRAVAFIVPATTGWLLYGGDGPPRAVATLTDVATAIPSDAYVQLALPTSALVLERLTLPSTQREELAGMVRLQSEKSLLFSLEEVSSDFVTVATHPQESAVLSVTVPHTCFETLCQPLREHRITPERATPFVFHVAAACPEGEPVLVVYGEHEQLVVGIVESRTLSWAHVLSTIDADQLAGELPQLLLSAMMDGVPTTFSHVYLAEDCSSLSPVLREFFEGSVETLPTVEPDLALAINLMPPSWRQLRDQLQNERRFHQRLILGATLCLVAAAMALLYLGILKHQSAQLDKQLSALRPKVALMQARQALLQTLGPAIDPHRYPIETLYVLFRNLAGDEVRLTEFDQTLDQWRIVGEAPSATLAGEYISRVKSEAEFARYEISADPPRMLANEHWQFNILGKQ